MENWKEVQTLAEMILQKDIKRETRNFCAVYRLKFTSHRNVSKLLQTCSENTIFDVITAYTCLKTLFVLWLLVSSMNLTCAREYTVDHKVLKQV